MVKSRGNPGNGPPKGKGNGNPKAPNFNSETGRAAVKKRGTKAKRDPNQPGFLAAKMRAYREKKLREDPNWKPPERSLNNREFQDLARQYGPEMLAILLDIASSTEELALARVRAAEILVERGYGKAPLTIQHERKLEELTDAELAAELARVAQENGFIIEADPGSYRAIEGTPAPRELEVAVSVGGDGTEAVGAEAGRSPLPVDRKT